MGAHLTADRLGRTGEDLFARLCSQSDLVCNKSDWDRSGWDFVVDAPADPAAGKTLDQRAPRSCVVQLKSTTNGNPIRLALSAIEPVAKDPRPAFVIVFRLTPDGREVTGYLIHLVGPILARVLQRLRHAQAHHRVAIHRASISLDYTALGVRFDLTPSGLRQALEQAFGPDVAAYLREKQRQLEDLGYDDDRLQAQATFWVESGEHLSRVLVGLEPLKPVALQAFDVRFGLAVPYSGPAFDDLEELRIEPPRIGPCRVSIRGEPLSPAAVFSAEAFVGPPIEVDGAVWLLIRHADFTISFVVHGVQFRTEGDFNRRRRTLGDLRTLARALAYLATGKGEVGFQFEGDVVSRLSLPMTDQLDGPDIESLPHLVRFLDAWSTLTEMAGVLTDAPFSLEDLWGAKGIQMAADVMTNPASAAHFAFDLDAFGPDVEIIEGVYFNSCRLGGAALSYGVKVTLSRFSDEYRSTAFTPLDAGPQVDDLQAYGEELARAADVQVLIHPDNVIDITPTMIGATPQTSGTTS